MTTIGILAVVDIWPVWVDKSSEVEKLFIKKLDTFLKSGGLSKQAVNKYMDLEEAAIIYLREENCTVFMETCRKVGCNPRLVVPLIIPNNQIGSLVMWGMEDTWFNLVKPKVIGCYQVNNTTLHVDIFTNPERPLDDRWPINIPIY